MMTCAPAGIVTPPSSTGSTAYRNVACGTGRVVAEELLDRGGDPVRVRAQHASWSGWRSSATTLFPMRLAVVSCPATISWKIVESSSVLSGARHRRGPRSAR